MYYVTDGLYCLSNQVIWQDLLFISIMQVLAVASDDFVALSTCSSNVMLQEAVSVFLEMWKKTLLGMLHTKWLTL